MDRSGLLELLHIALAMARSDGHGRWLLLGGGAQRVDGSDRGAARGLDPFE